ncbi:MAG: amino acid adenylation domain-containing protein [Flammeovirgaceae bacterium]
MGIYFIENEQGLNLLIEYRKDLFAANTISGLIDYLKAVLLQIGSNPMDKVHQLIQSADYPFSIQHSPEAARPTGTFHGEFAQQVFKNGDALAVISQDQCLTYSELDQKSTAWAHYLKQQGWGKGDLLGLGVNRSPESIIGMLAILKIGAAYVPIDPTYPSQIKSHILNTKNLQGCVVPDELAQQFASSSFPILTFNDIDVKHNANHSPLAVAVHSNDPMYVIYTSGSTGLPKGVMATHGNVLSLAKALKQTLYPNNQPLRFSLNGSMAFDTSVKQLCSLLYGGGLVFIPQAIRFDGLELIQYLEKQQVNILDVTPSQFTFLKLENFLHQWKHKKQVLFGGEKVSTALWEEAAAIPDLQCYNLYGITECTVDSTLTAISTAQEVNVGKVLHGTSVYILNESLEPVPQGMTGEIYIGGANVTIGYWDQSSLTASKFLPDPFVQQSGARMYKTGDCGKLLADGRLVLSGRIDRELKIRGYRFKPEFIESILNKHPRIQQAGVLVNKQQSNQISAFIQAKKQVENGLYQLPNGLSMSYLNSNEIEFLYRDIFENNAYLRHGIQLPKNACVLDVGANIGMFSLLINRLAPEATIYSFEPNPHVYHKLAQNVARYQIKGAAFNYGLSNEEKTAEFTFYPKFSFLSGLHADKQENMEMVQSYIRKTQASSSISDELIQTLLEDRFENESLTVALKTLSSFIATHQIQQIDLLKINVEKSELEVLKGLAPADWKKIKQLVFEFHDDKQELEEVTNMLKEQGYRVHVQQDWSTDQADQVYYIYASVYELNPSQDVPHEWMALGQDTLSNQQLNQYLSAYLPFGILPSAYTIVEEIPLTAQGKVDYQALQKYQQAVHIAAEDHSLTEVEQQVRNIWEELLGITVSRTSSFFEVGGHSLLLMALRDKIEQTFNYAIPITQLFDYPTISEQAHMIQQLENAQPLNLQTTRQPSTTHETTREAIAIIGMSMRLPEADSAAAFWNNLIHGHESISAWPKPQLIEDGVPETLFTREDYVNAAGVIQDYACFDANFFGYSNREASLMDPQHRLLLEYAWEALESAGYAPTNLQKPTGVYVGSSINSYMIHHIDRFKELIPELGSHQLIIANDKDHLATHIAYKLNLEGPAVTVQTACSTSLAAVHMACQSLKTGDSELAIAGGVSVRIPHHAGYIYQKGGILSPDGHCRSFDAAAQGTVPGSGIGLVVLKKLDAAIRDHDQIHAVILGSALNNDGGKKVGYTAPAVEGQARCIAKALKTAQVDPSAISYIEAHGTGTALGDPVEIAALNEVFKQDELKEKSCALGSVKSNIGHLDAAAGVAGLIKTVLALKHQTIPPSLHFNSPNQEIAFHQGPFYVNAKLKEWQSSSKRTAGVSSFGLGGTNAHVVLQEAPRIAKVQAVSSHFLFLFSAKSEHSLSQVLAKFLDFCQTPPEERLIDVAYTLMEGRACFDYRFACIASSYQELAECLQTALTHKDFRKATASSTPHVHILTLQEPVVRLQELRGRWLNGDLIRGDFSGGNMPYKVALPTYAFEKVIHWMEAPKIAHAHPRSSNVNQHDETQAAPDDAVEPFVKKAWESILGEQVESNTADFFEMGGNSLLAVQLLTRIQEKFGVEIEVIDLFDFPTVGELSAHIHSCIEPEQSSTQLLQDVDDLSEQELDFLIESFEITDEE